MKKSFKPVFLAALIPMLVLTWSCNNGDFLGSNEKGDSDEADSYLAIEVITDEDGDIPIFSDVWHHELGRVNDNAIVGVIVYMKSPTAEPSDYNDIYINEYRITYTRADGNNEPGVDVPYPVSGPISRLLDVGLDEDIVVVAINHNAKAEPPLSDLKNSSDVIVLTANLELYGEDLAGRNVKSTAEFEIHCANFGDEE